MYSFVAALVLTGAASASVLPRTSGCCFELVASGGESGKLGQLSDGQNRIGGDYKPATYCIDDGAITDGSGRGCILTPPTTQFQCDTGATPTKGFSITSSGEVEYNGDSTFYACGATTDEYNVYTTPVKDQADCHKITLMASNGGQCAGAGKSASSSMASSSAPAKSSMMSSSLATSSAPAKSSSMMSKSMPAYSSSAKLSAMSSSMAASTCMPASTVTVTVTATEACSKPATETLTPTIMTTVKTFASPSTVTESSKVTNTVVVSTTNTVKTMTPASSAPSKPVEYSSKSSAASMAPSKPNGSACPTALTGAYQTPHLIVPISSEHPDQAYGTSYNGQINSTTSTIFNFDIPASYSGKQCSVIFLFPEQKDLETSSFTFSGSGSVDFTELSSAATEQTSWKSAPAAKKDLGSIAVIPGNSYMVATVDCPAGQVESIEMSSKGGLGLEFFEDYNPSPIGLYITAC